jgi:hypothetical protein
MKPHLRAIILAALCGAFFCSPALAQKTKAQLSTEVSTTFPDNIVGAITPLGVRTFQNDLLNSIMPTAPVTAGNLACFDGVTGLLKDCSLAPNVITVGATTVLSGTTKGLLYNNGGVLANTNSVAGGVLVTDGSFNPTLSATPSLGVAGSTVGSISFANATSGSVTLQPATGALGAAAASLPAGNYTVVGDGISQTLTNKTINGASNSLTVRLANDVTGTLPFSNLPTGTQDTILGYWGSTAISATAVSNCTGALTYSTTTHTFGCNTSSGTGTVTSVTCGTGLSGGTITTTGTCALALTNATLQATPINPSGTSSASAVMAGLGGTCKLTPVYSTRIYVSFQAQVSNSTSGSLITVGLRYGTGSPPANGSAATGTVAASEQSYTASAVNSFAPLTSTAIITGLSVGTAYWFDFTQRVISGGTGSIQSVGCTAMEF